MFELHALHRSIRLSRGSTLWFLSWLASPKLDKTWRFVRRRTSMICHLQITQSFSAAHQFTKSLKIRMITQTKAVESLFQRNTPILNPKSPPFPSYFGVWTPFWAQKLDLENHNTLSSELLWRHGIATTIIRFHEASVAQHVVCHVFWKKCAVCWCIFWYILVYTLHIR